MPDSVSVLSADPELGERLEGEDLDAARAALATGVVTVERGVWRPERLWSPDDHPALGLLMLDGLITRRSTVAGRASTELIGPGDLLRPWDMDAPGLIPVEIEWEVLLRTRHALLDARFVSAAAAWPAVIDAIAARGACRSRWLALQLAMRQIIGVEGRLLLLLWALSERWGVVTRRGVVLRLRLTHEVLGMLIGARRPSVTTAIGVLTEAGELERIPDGYRLYGDIDTALRRAAGEAMADVEAA